MNRVFIAAVATVVGTANLVVVSNPVLAQTDTAISKPSDWNKLMPNSMPHSNPSMPLLDPTIKHPETLSERVNKNTREALAWAQKNDWDRALESVDKAIALDPSIDFLYKLRSHVYKNIGRNSESVKDMMKFNEMQKTNNINAIEKYHKDQVNQAGLPDLRDRVKTFLGN